MGKTYLEKQKENNNGSFGIHVDENVNVDMDQSFNYSFEQSRDLSRDLNLNQNLDQSMNQSLNQSMDQRMNIMQTGNMKNKIADQLKDAMPDVLAEKQIMKAPKQLNPIDAPDVSESIYTVPTSFMFYKETDDVYMKEVRRNFKLFKEMDVMKRGVTTVEGRDILNGLISACRWYNALHWKFWGKEGKRLREVKQIRDLAIKERDKMNKEINGDSMNRYERQNREYDRFYKEDQTSRFPMNKMEAEERGRYLLRNTGGADATVLWSRLWARFKAYTFGFVGRNILNLAMGAVAGASWLVTWPIARAYAAASGKERYKKGFNIKIPHPMSPAGWYQHYMYNQKHAWGATLRQQIRGHGNVYQTFYLAAKSLQYNLWDPFKHLVTLNMDMLSGGGYYMPHRKEIAEDRYKRSDDDVKQADSKYNENDEDELEAAEAEETFIEAKKNLTERHLDPNKKDEAQILTKSSVFILAEKTGKFEEDFENLPTVALVDLAKEVLSSTEPTVKLRDKVDEVLERHKKPENGH